MYVSLMLLNKKVYKKNIYIYICEEKIHEKTIYVYVPPKIHRPN